MATANGSYRCAITLNGCSDFSICKTVSTVGINDPLNDQEKNTFLYPNPTNGVLNLQSSLKFERCLIAEVSGRVLFSQSFMNDTDLDISDLEAGVYFITLFTNGGRQLNYKIIKR